MTAAHLGRWCLPSLLGVALCLSAAAAGAQPAEKLPGEELPPPKRVAEGPTAAAPLAPSILGPGPSPIDLATALRLAGVSNPEILLARERVVEAVALHQQAAVKFLPTINAGTNVDSHTGNLQQAKGNILAVNRGAMYLGLGANAVAAGTVNVPGVVVSGNVSEGIYAALVTRQVVRQREFASLAVRNDVLLRVAGAYLELLRAEGRRAVASQTRADAREVARITAAFSKTGQGQQSDADRAATTFEQWNATVLETENELLTASARLAQFLDLDPSVRLQATDGWVVPAPVVPDPIPLPQLLAIAVTRRPELAQRQAAIRAALLTLQGAKVLPFSPNVTLGYSAGTFGGGSNLAAAGILQPDGTILQENRFGNFADRQDFDAVVYWSLQNLGVGNLALIRLAQSHLRTEDLRRVQVLDRVRTQVATAYAGTHARFAQIATNERAVRSSKDAFDEDLRRILNHQGLPIELLDSLRLLGQSRSAYLDAIVDYNEAQIALYVALGQPPANQLARPIPAALVPAPAAPQGLPVQPR